MVKRLKKKIDNFKQQDNFEKFLDIFFYISLIIGFIIGAMYAFSIMDFTPASPDDFKPLYEQKDLIEVDFFSVLDMENATINPSTNSIKVLLSSEECNLLLHFNKDFKITSSQETDNFVPIFIVILCSIFFGFLGMVILFILFFILVSAFLFFTWISMRLSKKIFKNKESSNNDNSETQE